MKKIIRSSRKDALIGLHIGTAIKTFLAQKNLSIRTVSNELGLSKVGLTSRLEQPYYATAHDLAEISIVCGHNFFAPYLTWLQANGVPSEAPELQQRLAEAEKQNAELQQALAQCRLLNDFLITENTALKTKKRDPSV